MNKTLTVQYKGMYFRENKNGTFTVSAEDRENGIVVKKWTATVDTFAKATSWLWNMAPNNDFADMFIERICDKRGCFAYSL